MTDRARHRLGPVPSLVLGVVLLLVGLLHAVFEVLHPLPVRVLAVVVFLALGALFVRRFLVRRRSDS